MSNNTELKFQSSWTADYGMLSEGNKARCILCSARIECKFYTVRRHYELRHKDLLNKTKEEQREIIAEVFKKKNFNTPPQESKKIPLIEKFESSKWTENYGMIFNGTKALCVLCSGTVICRTYSIRRHYETTHKELLSKTKEEQKEYIAKAVQKSKMNGRKPPEPKKIRANAKTAAFSISQLIASYGKSCCDGEFIKKLWFDSALCIFEDFENMEEILNRIHSLPEIKPKIMVMDIAKNIIQQQNLEIRSSQFYSLCIDESIDKIGLLSLAIIIRYIVGDEIKEEFISLNSIPAKPKGSDISYVVIKVLSERRLDFTKIISITTDGSIKMLNAKDGFMKLFQHRVGTQKNILGFHSIMHPKVLCEKVGSVLEDIMSIITETVHLIPARDPNRTAFFALISETKTVYNDILMYNDVRFFGRGQILQNFVDCLDHIIPFLYKEKLIEKHDQLNYSFEGQARIMFFTDLCKYIYMINEKLQEDGKHILKMIEIIKEIDVEFKKFELDIICNAFQYFPNVKNIFFGTKWKTETSVIEDLTKEFTEILQSIHKQCALRFQEIIQLEETLSFLVYPDTVSVVKLNLQYFEWINWQNFQLELVEFQNIPVWKQKFVKLRKNLLENQNQMLYASCIPADANNEILETWNMIPASFLWLKKLAFAILTIFPSTRACESLFDHISLIKNSSNQIVSNEYSEACCLLKVTNYQPDLNYLVAQMGESIEVVAPPESDESSIPAEN